MGKGGSGVSTPILSLAWSFGGQFVRHDMHARQSESLAQSMTSCLQLSSMHLRVSGSESFPMPVTRGTRVL